MNKVPIPESFMIFGKTYRVSFDSNLKSNHDAVGCLNYTTGKVYLSPNTIESPRCKEEIERTFFHWPFNRCMRTLYVLEGTA